MKSLTLLLAALVLSACTAQESPSQKTDVAQAPTILQCAKDTDCKGDRICDNGACANPPPPSAIQATPVETVAATSAATRSLPASNGHDTSEYKEAYSCAMESFKDGYGGGPAAYCVGNSRDPSEIEEQAYKDAERDFSSK